MDKSEKILLVALELIIERGLERTPMSMIADKAEVGMGTVYRYFKDKEDIINHIYIKIKEEEAALIFMNYADNRSVEKTFKDYYGRMIDYFLNNHLRFSFICQYAFSPIITKEVQEKAMAKFHHFDTMYKIGLKEQLFKKLPAAHMTYFIFSSIAFWLKAAGELKITVDKKYKAKLLQMAWDSIKK